MIPPTRRGRIISPDLPGFNPRRGRRLTVKGLIPFSSGDNGRTRRRGCVCFAPVPRLVSSGSGGLSVPPRGPSSVSSIGAAALRPPLLVSDTLTSAEISATGGRRRFVPSGRLRVRRSVSRPASFGPGWFRPSRPLGPIPRAGRSLFPAPSMGARVGANRVRSRLSFAVRIHTRAMGTMRVMRLARVLFMPSTRRSCSGRASRTALRLPKVSRSFATSPAASFVPLAYQILSVWP